MLKKSVWDKVVNFYSLVEYEKEAEERFYENYEYRKIIGHRYSDDEHLFICYECMEKALGRKIEPPDLINIGVPLNMAFEEMYFK